MAEKPSYEELEKRIEALDRKLLERRRAEEAFRECEEAFLQFAGTTRQLFWLVSPDYREFIYISPGAGEIWGQTCADLYDNPSLWMKAVHPEDLDRIDRALAGSIGDTLEMEYRIVRPDGSVRWIRERGWPVRDGSGAVYRRAGIAEDITERRHEEQDASHIRNIVERSMNEIYILNAATLKFLMVTRGAQENLGYSMEAFQELTLSDIAPGFTIESFDKLIAPLRSREQDMICLNTFLRRKDDSVYPAEISLQILDRDTSPVIVAFAWDRTARKNWKEKLLESEGRYKSLFRDNHSIMMLIDPATGELVDVNSAACEFYGYQRQEMLGLTMHEINTLSREETTLEMQRAKSEKRSYYLFSHRLSDGEIRDVEVYSGPIEIRDRKLLYSIVHDVSGRVKAEEEAKKLEAQLRQAQKVRAIGALAGGIAHDFNNILFPITGYTEMTIADLPEQSGEKKNLIEVLKAAQRAKELVRQILQFSRESDSEKVPLKAQPLVREALQLLRATIPTNIEFRQQIDKTCGPILANPSQIHQIVMNLCTNAAHAMEAAGGCMTIGLKEVFMDSDTPARILGLAPGPHILLSVSDTGQGMDQTTMEHIFDPYFTTKEQGKGTGLGLSTVHGIVKNCGGTIRVESEPDRGTTFKVYLPRIENSDLKTEAAPMKEIPGGSERILLVDDEEQIVRMVKRMLEAMGYDVTGHTSSVKAKETFGAAPRSFDLVITDMTMPHMTGMELSRELIRIRPDIPIILCTGFSSTISEEKAKEAGIREFVIKPALKNEMARAIRQALDNQKEKQRLAAV